MNRSLNFGGTAAQTVTVHCPFFGYSDGRWYSGLASSPTFQPQRPRFGGVVGEMFVLLRGTRLGDRATSVLRLSEQICLSCSAVYCDRVVWC